jgi:hypothetical protein
MRFGRNLTLISKRLANGVFSLLLLCAGANAFGAPPSGPATNPPADSLSTVMSESPAQQSNSHWWLMAYFRQRYDSRVEIDAAGKIHNVPLPNPMREEQLHFALSHDGRHWTPLNGNRPVWNQRLRDPFLARDQNGVWRLVATGGQRGSGGTNQGPTCLYATSRDLITWEDVRSLNPMAGVRNDDGLPAGNVWAPEWFYDRKSGDFVLLWSSSFADAGWKQSRIWWTHTRDWQTFAPAKVLFAPPYSAIDATLIEHGGTYYLFHKEEEFGAATGERRAIRLATSQQLAGPYQIFNGPLNRGQIAPTITEGPSVLRDPQGAGWLLLYDYCMSDAYGASVSPDLLHWSVVSSVTFPPDARHGCFAPLTDAEAKLLLEKFGAKTVEPASR